MGMGRCCGDGRSYWRADDGGKRFGERSGIGPEPDLGGDQRITRMVQIAQGPAHGLDLVELVVLLAALTKPAYGYVDPGSGLLAVQVGGSMLAGGLFILRSKIRRLFGMTSNEGKIEAEKSAQPEPSK